MKIPARMPSGGFFRNELLCIFVSDAADITMDRYDLKYQASLCWAAENRQAAWTQARIIALAWAADSRRRAPAVEKVPERKVCARCGTEHPAWMREALPTTLPEAVVSTS